MPIVSFYSYKGGSGRSLMLASVALLLAQKHQRVVCVDFDLQSGGLHRFFGLNSETIQHTLLDLLTTLSPLDVPQVIIDLTDRLLEANERAGKLWLLPTITEPSKLRDTLDASTDITSALADILKAISTVFDPTFVLVDSPSGFSELASGPIINADYLVCLLRPDSQSVEGLRTLFDILDTLGQRPTTLLVVSQVPDTPEASNAINKLQSNLGAGRHFDILIPYIPKLGLDANLIVESTDRSLINHFVPVMDWLEAGIE